MGCRRRATLGAPGSLLWFQHLDGGDRSGRAAVEVVQRPLHQLPLLEFRGLGRVDDGESVEQERERLDVLEVGGDVHREVPLREPVSHAPERDVQVGPQTLGRRRRVGGRRVEIEAREHVSLREFTLPPRPRGPGEAVQPEDSRQRLRASVASDSKGWLTPVEVARSRGVAPDSTLTLAPR